jgi:hypothetical protein
MRTVAIESPYKGDVNENLKYLDECILDCLNRGETPYASHKMLTTALDDNDPHDRMTGIDAGISMSCQLDYVVFYVDRGWSSGMLVAKDYYDENDIGYEVRRLYHENNMDTSKTR